MLWVVLGCSQSTFLESTGMTAAATDIAIIDDWRMYPCTSTSQNNAYIVLRQGCKLKIVSRWVSSLNK